MLNVRWDFIGLSTDSKPTIETGKVVNGSTFYEVDTSTLYIYYGGNWIKQEYEGGKEGQTIQYEVMPKASSSFENKVIQYVGDTTSDYTKGYFYTCVGVGDPKVYSWIEISVQPSEEVPQEVYFIQSNSSSDPFIFDGKKRGLYLFTFSSYPFYYKVRETDATKSISNTYPSQIEIYEDLDFTNISSPIHDIGRFYYFEHTLNYRRNYCGGRLNIDYVSPTNISVKVIKNAIYGQFVDNGTQTYEGTKTFINLPKQQTYSVPTQDTEFTTKKYVDDQVAGAGGGEKVYVLDLDEVMPNYQEYEKIISYQAFNTTEVKNALSEIITDASQNNVGYINLDVYCYNNSNNKKRVRFTMNETIYTQGTEYNRISWLHGVEGMGMDSSTQAVYSNFGRIYIQNVGMSWNNGVCTVTQVYDANYEEFNIGGTLNLSAIAPEYLTYETYAVGDYVTHQNGLYKCTVANSAEGYFNPAHWEETNVIEVIKNL